MPSVPSVGKSNSFSSPSICPGLVVSTIDFVPIRTPQQVLSFSPLVPSLSFACVYRGCFVQKAPILRYLLLFPPNEMSLPHPRLPARTTTFDYEGWMQARQEHKNHVVCPPPPKPSPPSSTFLANPRWDTDIVTFCSHIARDPHLGRARVTQIQNRKSRRVLSSHEYILLFFSIGQREFVVRVDGSVKSGPFEKEQAPLSVGGTRQRVTVYHVPTPGDGATTTATAPWFEQDGKRGSELVASLTTWSSLGASGVNFVSHHLATAREGSSGQGPSLHDVVGLVETVVLERPASYVTSRSTLLVIYNCFPHDFACSLGEEEELVPASMLEEPAWASLLRWYFPFTAIALVLYFLAVIVVHVWVGRLLASPRGNRVLDAAQRCMRDPTAPECELLNVHDPAWKSALRLMLHLVLDLPFPVGLLHTWLSSLELSMGTLVKRVSTRYLNESFESGEPASEQPDDGLPLVDRPSPAVCSSEPGPSSRV
ncbi:hypothetical protein AG1IA_06337 [Rhizoctonia solani AG-1 IA]|uniref:Transmembrane protein n=1 Tax=Thanatephorus cucumeris (strain AG1-IA) TaxID=983506 RepID=L8WSB7_THACA|nr:hypothetical protein AG1IA_06337 [Rhizoctonia solani AG-1 IA]